MGISVDALRPAKSAATFARSDLAHAARRLERRIRLGRLPPPIFVRSAESGYEILVGYTTWHASRLAGSATVHAKLCESPETSKAVDLLLATARDPLRQPIPTAHALRAITKEFHATSHVELSFLLNWPRNVVSHYLLLLELPDAIQSLVERAQLTFGHAKVLCSKTLADKPKRQLELAHDAVARRWSVRELEASVKGTAPAEAPSSAAPPTSDPSIVRLEQHLSEVTGLRTRIEHGTSGAGRVVFEYYSLEESDNLFRFFPRAE